jgi:hypothetical protein
MKKLGSAILFWALCFSVCSFLQAQSRSIPAIVAPTAVVQPATIYKADIKVAHFQNIVGVQFTLKWNADVLRFREVKNLILDPNPQMDRFGKANTDAGMLTFSWFDDALKGRSLDDSTTLFSIEFDVVGISNTFSPLQFTDDVTVREVADTSFNEIQVSYHDGNIRIAETTGVYVYNSAPHLISVQNTYPNPFQDFTQVQLELKKTTPVRLLIQDVQGKTVYEEQRVLTTGAHTLQLTKEMFPAAGAYQYSLIATDFIVTQKLIFL